MSFAVGASAYRNGLKCSGPTVLTSFNLVFFAIACAPFAYGVPFNQSPFATLKEGEGTPAEDPSLWAYLGTAVALVLLGGAFAGLTIALMGQDEIYLQVIATSGEGSEQQNAKKVLKLLKKGKHWVLVTLLLGNVITNETLPIVLDRSLGGGWPAVLSSTVLIVIFGEIAPQSICVRYGLPIGAWMSPFVLALMWIMSPVAWPTAKLLDKLLGEDHGTTYKKAGLKTLVTLHKTLGTSPDERLNQDEVTIISAVLDLKDKPVGSIMTPMNDVFTMSADTVLNEKMMDTILSAGYSRIPIYAPDNARNFVGMLLVKMLITYDPEDALRVRDFALATLPETRPETSCLDIVNFFQEGKSHMVLVSDFPGEPYGALGVVTLEDVIEELIGEEIIDESDVFIDVHKAIRRLTPAPRTRVPKGEIVADAAHSPENVYEVLNMSDGQPTLDITGPEQRKSSVSELGVSPKVATFLMRRRSSGNGSIDKQTTPLALRSNTPEIREHLKHLGPSNAAHRPKQTRINTVKIKPGVGTIPENAAKPQDGAIVTPTTSRGGIGEGLLESAGRGASDGVRTLQAGYGTINSSAHWATSWPQDLNANGDGTKSLPQGSDDVTSPKSQPHDENVKIVVDNRPASQSSGYSTSTLGSLHSVHSRSRSPMKRHKHTTARSGSITENFVDLGGVKKMVLETASSSDIEEARGSEGNDNKSRSPTKTDTEGEGKTDEDGGKKSGGKKKRKKRAGRKKHKGAASESASLLGWKS